MALTKGWVSSFIFEVNHLVDAGFTETIEAIHEAIKNKNIVSYLANRYEGEIDLSALIQTNWGNELSEALYDQYNGYAGDERRKWGISNNGLCLLIAWTLEVMKQHVFE